MKKLTLFALCALICAPLFHACNDNTERPLLGLALNNPSNAWRTQLKNNAAETASSYAADLDYVLRSATSAEEQATQLQALKDAGCTAVVIVPEGDLSTTVVSELITAGIAVFLVEEKMSVNYTGFSTVSNTEVGEKAGEWLAAQGASRVISFHVPQNEPVSAARVQGFTSKIGSIANVTLDCDLYTRENGKALTEAILADAQYADVDAIYAQDDEVALGVLEALAEAPGSNIEFVIGCGGSADFFSTIKSSSLTLATTLYSPSMVSVSVKQAAEWLINGTTPSPRDAYLPVVVVDETNVDTETPF